MKAVIASLATALVLTGAAWAGKITPGNVAALSREVVQLQHEQHQLQLDVAVLQGPVACLRNQWNQTGYVGYAVQEWNGFNTPSGSVNLFEAPSTADGITGKAYLLETPTELTTC